jgi:acyl-CoA synthetase (AMP-forming)/AMP-acid ligase II
VVPVSGTSPQAADRLLESVEAVASSRLAADKRPKRYVVLDDLPRTATGKVRRTLIADLLDQGSGQGSPSDRGAGDGR